MSRAHRKHPGAYNHPVYELSASREGWYELLRWFGNPVKTRSKVDDTAALKAQASPKQEQEPPSASSPAVLSTR